MSGTALDHWLVRRYLTQLDVATRGLPAAQARELKDQIIAHLDDALPADADDQQVAVVLTRLGTPADLTAEARPALGRTLRAAIVVAARRGWASVAAARLRTKILAGLTVLLLAAGATYLNVQVSAPLIQFAGSSGWWYSQDSMHEVDTSADGAQQSTVPIRSGHRQAFAIGIENPSNFTETIIGPVGGLNPPWDSPNGGFGRAQIGVSVPDREIANGGMIDNVAFTLLPASIPPHQYRLLRISWTSAICLEGNGSASGIDTLYLRVRVGWFTRTDIIPLPMAFALAGPSHSMDTQPGPNYNKCI
jgi:hypothetical protein